MVLDMTVNGLDGWGLIRGTVRIFLSAKNFTPALGLMQPSIH
jgi:hypothetical protein